MALFRDQKRGGELAGILQQAFLVNGILGKKEMPEDVVPVGIERGSLEHLLFITLTVTIDYQRDAVSLWESSRKTYEDPETRYLFWPKSLHETPFQKIIEDMQKYKLSKKPFKDPKYWHTVGVTFYKKWGGNPSNFLENCDWDALKILKRLREDTHSFGGKIIADYPFLRGNKIGPLWIRILRDNVKISNLKNLDKVPIPVDIHVAKATLSTGVVRGQFLGELDEIFEYVRMAWFESVKGLYLKDRPMIALDVDEPLWNLSKYGCRGRDKYTGKCSNYNRCEAKDFCVRGTVNIFDNNVELKT